MNGDRVEPSAWHWRLLVVSGAFAGVGLVSVVVLLLQPWASCPEIDDSPAACPVEGVQADVQFVAL